MPLFRWQLCVRSWCVKAHHTAFIRGFGLYNFWNVFCRNTRWSVKSEFTFKYFFWLWMYVTNKMYNIVVEQNHGDRNEVQHQLQKYDCNNKIHLNTEGLNNASTSTFTILPYINMLSFNQSVILSYHLKALSWWLVVCVFPLSSSLSGMWRLTLLFAAPRRSSPTADPEDCLLVFLWRDRTWSNARKPTASTYNDHQPGCSLSVRFV